MSKTFCCGETDPFQLQTSLGYWSEIVPSEREITHVSGELVANEHTVWLHERPSHDKVEQVEAVRAVQLQGLANSYYYAFFLILHSLFLFAQRKAKQERSNRLY